MNAVLYLALGLTLMAWAGVLGNDGAPVVMVLGLFSAGVSLAVPQAMIAAWREWRDQ